MRIGFNTSYIMMQEYQQRTQGALLDITKQLSSGMKIQFANEGSSTFSDTLRLDYENTTLNQTKTVAQNGRKFTDNTDTALSQLSQSMDDFKTKLIHAANEIHSDESIEAIANDLEGLREHFRSLANTTVGEQYIFSGTAVSTEPINENGVYSGNDQKLQALVGSKNLLTYNITGKELFLSQDDNKNRILTTNVKHFNQNELYPDIMSPDNKGKTPAEVFAKESDTLRSFLGDDNDVVTDDPSEFFYISGTDTNGIGFAEKFSLNPSYVDEDNATTVRDMLDRVGVAFGNTTTNKVVDVSLNEWGQIEVKDLTEGQSKINFHMVSSKADVNDTDTLISSGERITEYVKSNYYSLPTSTNARSVMEDSDHRIHEIPTLLKLNDNSIARPTDTILSVFGVDGPDIQLSGTAVSPDGTTPGGAVGPVTPLAAGATVDDLLTQIKQNYSTAGAPYDDIDVELTNGRIIITDKTVLQTRTDIENPPYDGTSSLDVQIASAGGTNIFSNDFSAEVDKVRFEKSGSYLNANTSQVIAHNNEYATGKTKLIEVSSPQRIDGSFEYSLDGKTLQMDIEDVNGTPYHINVNLATAGSTYNLTNTNTGVNYGPYELFENYDSTVSTPADEVTYEQLTNIMEIGLNFSNLVASGNTPSVGSTPADVNNYRDAVLASQELVDASLDYRGRLEVYDKTQNESLINLSMYDDDNSDFTAGSAKFAKLAFHENNALVVDDPHVDFFDSVDKAIEAVQRKIYRPDGYNQEKDYDADPRNIGIQNSITVFDHLLDHVNKVHAKNGAQANALQYSVERSEIMIVQAKTLKSQIVDTDFAEASMQLSQLQLNYQAMLSSISKINKLSLVNYL